jgi:hypothetical protein
MKTKFLESENELLFNQYGNVSSINICSISQMGCFAREFISRWGMVAAVPDGEDSSGRAKVRLSTPEELVVRAFETAELFHKALEEKNCNIRFTHEQIKEFITVD